MEDGVGEEYVPDRACSDFGGHVVLPVLREGVTLKPGTWSRSVYVRYCGLGGMAVLTKAGCGNRWGCGRTWGWGPTCGM